MGSYLCDPVICMSVSRERYWMHERDGGRAALGNRQLRRMGGRGNSTFLPRQPIAVALSSRATITNVAGTAGRCKLVWDSLGLGEAFLGNACVHGIDTRSEPTNWAVADEDCRRGRGDGCSRRTKRQRARVERARKEIPRQLTASRVHIGSVIEASAWHHPHAC